MTPNNLGRMFCPCLVGQVATPGVADLTHVRQTVDQDITVSFVHCHLSLLTTIHISEALRFTRATLDIDAFSEKF